MSREKCAPSGAKLAIKAPTSCGPVAHRACVCGVLETVSNDLETLRSTLTDLVQRSQRDPGNLPEPFKPDEWVSMETITDNIAGLRTDCTKLTLLLHEILFG